MSKTPTYLDCWLQVAASLFAQALAGEPTLHESLPKPMPPESFGFAALIEGDEAGRLAIMLDASLADAALLGDGTDQKAGWAELLREVAEAAAGDLLARTGRRCRVTDLIPTTGERRLSCALELRSGGRTWLIQVNSELTTARETEAVPAAKGETNSKDASVSGRKESSANVLSAGAKTTPASDHSMAHSLSGGLDLLLDVELEASLRFGSREMPLGEILDLGPGDVVQLDRHVSDPVDLIVGDKIVARGEVVLVNGNFGLRVTEVAEPQRRLESIRCLF